MGRSPLLQDGVSKFDGRTKSRFGTCNGGSNFLTLDETHFGAGGPISKFQSPRAFIYFRLSMSILNFASGALEMPRSGQHVTNFGVKWLEIANFQIEPGSSRRHLELNGNSFH